MSTSALPPKADIRERVLDVRCSPALPMSVDPLPTMNPSGEMWATDQP
jgi:hypothetical protein